METPAPSRRTILKSTAAVAAAMPRYAMSVDSAPKKLRIGVVGGRFGLQFQWHLHPDCIVEAVSDLRPERRKRLQEVYKCEKAYDSLEEMVRRDKNIDAVAVFTDGPLHVRHTVDCMKHGKHVISAVPAAWATLDECAQLKEIVESTGLTYMMAETSYYQQFTISARKFYEAGEFGELYYCESEYMHDGVDVLAMENGKRTWRYGVAPLHYPTHCTAHLVSVTGERLTSVAAHGWGDGSPMLKDNAWGNPFSCGAAMFRTNRDHAFRMNLFFKGALVGVERAKWIGSQMSFYAPMPTVHEAYKVVRTGKVGKDSAGFAQGHPKVEPYAQPQWWQTDMLPEPMRVNSGHEGSHAFLTHEFVDAMVHGRKPAIDVYESLAYTAPGIVAQQSALRDGETLAIPQYDVKEN